MNAMFKLSKSTSPVKLFRSDCITLYKTAYQRLQRFFVADKYDVHLQCDAIRWEQFENCHFSRCYHLYHHHHLSPSNDLILVLKTSTRPYSCLAEVVYYNSKLAEICGSLVVGS